MAETVVTFEEEPVPVPEIERRIREVRGAQLPWVVAEGDGALVGYAYASPWRARRAYRLSREVTVYVAPGHQGRGIGTRLYARLLEDLRDRGIHTAIGGIALPNAASVALHEKLGFRKVAHFEEVGFKLGRRVDVGYWWRAEIEESSPRGRGVVAGDAIYFPTEKGIYRVSTADGSVVRIVDPRDPEVIARAGEIPLIGNLAVAGPWLVSAPPRPAPGRRGS